MKRNMKKLLLSAFVAIMASTTAAATVLSIAPADAETQTSRFAMVEGAGIRYSEPLGLRFIAELGEQEYTELTTDEDGVIKELGMFIMPFSYIDTNADTAIDVTDYASVETKLDYTFYSSDGSVEEKLYAYTDENGDTYYRANGVISNLKLQNYAREFVGIGYIKETKNGVTTYEYTDISYQDNVRSAAYVAIEAHADEDYKDNDTAKRTFVQYVDGAQLYTNWDVTQVDGGYAYNGNTYASLAEIKTQIGNYDYSLDMGSVKYVKEGGTAQLGAITDTTKDVAFAGMHAKYTSSDESIVKVDKYGTLTWVKNGMAKVTAEFMGETQTFNVISGVVDFEDGVVPSTLKFTGARVAEFTTTDMNGGKVMEVKSTSDAYGDVCVIMPRDIYGVFFEDPTVQYLAFDLKLPADATTTRAQVSYGGSGSYPAYESGGYDVAPAGYFKSYYLPRSVYEGWVSNDQTDTRLLNLQRGVQDGASMYIDNIRGVTAEGKAQDWYSFEYGGLRTNNGNQPLHYDHVDAGAWQLGFSNIDSTTATFTSEIVSEGNRAYTFTKKAGTTKMVFNHTADPTRETEMRNAGYIAYDLYVPEGSNASAVQDNSSGGYATLKQGWNTLYAKVDGTDNSVCTFWDSTASTYVIDNIRFITEEEYNTEMLSFEGKAGVLRDNFSSDYTYYVYTPRDVMAGRWTMAAQGNSSCTLSNLHYDTETVKDGNQSFAFHKQNGYQSFSLNTGGEMYSLLKNGFSFWVYADLDAQSGINGTSATNFIDGANNKFNGGAGINVTARQWTQVVVTAENINASGRFLIIQGSTAGTYYFDGFEPIESATITYDAGSLGTVDSTTQTVVYGFDYTLKTPTAYRDFLGWYNGDTLVPMTGTWNIAGNVTLTAKYADTVSFEDGVAPAYFTKADGTGDISIVDGGTDGNKMLQINANGSSPAMKATIEFLASFFNDSNVDYIAFDAKATKNNNNFRRDTKHSSGALNAVTYESDMTFTNPVDSVTYPTTGVRADGWKTFYFTRADYDFWVSQSATSARFIATGGFASGDQIYIDNIRPATAEDYSLSGYSFESVGIRVNDTGGKTLLFYMLGYGSTWQFNMSSGGFTNVGLTSENATDGNSALAFTKAAGNLDINFPSDKHPYTDIVTKTGYWAIDVYAPVDTDATVSTANTLFGQDGNTCVNLVEGAWTTVYVAGSMNKLSITDTNGGTYAIDNIRSVTAEEYEAMLPEYFYNAEGERDSDGSVTELTLNGGTHNAGTTESTAMPVAADHVTDMAYYRFHGNYGLDDFLVFDVTGENMPIVSFFTTNVKNSVYNHAQSEDEKAWIFFNGIYNHNGLPDGGYSGNLSNRLNLIGPYKITYKADNSGSENPKSNRLSDGSNPTNPSPASLAMLSGTTDQYRVMLGWVANGDSNMNLRVYVWNLTTGALVLDKAFGNVTKADWEGDIVLYGHFGKDTVVDKVYPIVTGFDNAKAAYTPAMQTYKATWDGNGLTLGAGYYEANGVSKPKTGTTDMAYIAYNGDYGVGDYVVFDFTGSNMPVVSFFNNEVTNTVYNNADSTADSKAAVDDNAHGIVICGGMYNMQKQSGLGAVGTNVNSCRLIIVGNKKVLSWDDGSNAYRVADGTTGAPNPLSITALEQTPDTTYRVIMGFSAAGKLEVRVINMITGALVYSYTKTGLTSNLETGSIAIHGQFGKDTVLDSVFGVEEDTTVDALLTKYAKDSDYSDEAAVELDRYAYSGPSHGQWTIDGVKQEENVVDYRTVEQYNQYKNAGFNILLAQDTINVSVGSWATDGKLVMDKAAAAGLKVILTDGRLQNLSEPVTISGTTVNGTAWAIGEGARFSNQASLDAYVMSCLSLYKDHPAFYGVMLGDEPSYQNAYCYGQVYQSIKRVMPECYVQYNLNPMQHNNYNMIKYWYDGSTPNSTPTAAQTEAAYKNYVIAFLDAMGTDYIQYDDYPFKSSTEKILGIFERTEPYIDPTALRNIQMVAEIAKERGLAVKVVTQSCLMRSGGPDGNVVIRQVTEDDARWLNNYLMGFGVKQISYFTYWTKSANSNSGEWFDDGGAFVKRDGTTTALYNIMKTIMANNTEFAKTISHFDYNASKVVTSSYKFADEHIVWGTLTSGSFKWVTGATTTTDATLVTELYDEEKYNYMYMVMNTIDPNEKNGNSKDTTQSITVTFDSSVTEFYVYDQSGNRTLQTGNTYTVSLTAGQAVYLMPKF